MLVTASLHFACFMIFKCIRIQNTSQHSFTYWGHCTCMFFPLSSLLRSLFFFFLWHWRFTVCLAVLSAWDIVNCSLHRCRYFFYSLLLLLLLLTLVLLLSHHYKFFFYYERRNKGKNINELYQGCCVWLKFLALSYAGEKQDRKLRRKKRWTFAVMIMWKRVFKFPSFYVTFFIFISHICFPPLFTLFLNFASTMSLIPKKFVSKLKNVVYLFSFR